MYLLYYFMYIYIKFINFNREDFIRYITTYNENDMHISSDDEEIMEIVNQSRIRLREIEASTIDNSLVVENAADLVISESDNTSIGNRSNEIII